MRHISTFSTVGNHWEKWQKTCKNLQNSELELPDKIITQQALSFKMQLLELPEEIITQLQQSGENYNLSDKNSLENITQVINLTETHCRYIYQLCNHSEIDKLFDSVYDDFKNV